MHHGPMPVAGRVILYLDALGSTQVSCDGSQNETATRITDAGRFVRHKARLIWRPDFMPGLPQIPGITLFNLGSLSPD